MMGQIRDGITAVKAVRSVIITGAELVEDTGTMVRVMLDQLRLFVMALQGALGFADREDTMGGNNENSESERVERQFEQLTNNAGNVKDVAKKMQEWLREACCVCGEGRRTSGRPPRTWAHLPSLCRT